MNQQLLFVYGTLKRGQSANHLLADGRFVRTATTLPKYRLLDLGDHPGLVKPSTPGMAIKGELWWVNSSSFPALDAYEGAPSEYGRQPISIEDCTEPVIAYFFLGDGSALPDCGAEWLPRPTVG
jgi:gamma-glutamylcyclotransferase (GGCT)/AIG2-like uncharacterized protein YtfP